MFLSATDFSKEFTQDNHQSAKEFGSRAGLFAKVSTDDSCRQRVEIKMKMHCTTITGIVFGYRLCNIPCADPEGFFRGRPTFL